jgi:hypothetical protein
MRLLTRCANRLLLALSAFLLWSSAANAEVPARWSITCNLSVSMSIKDQLASAIRQRIRALEDVAIGGAESPCDIGIVGLTYEERNAYGDLKVHFLSVVVTYHMDFATYLSHNDVWRSLKMPGAPSPELQRFLTQSDPETIKMHAIYSGTDLAELSDRIVAGIDNDVFEPSRQMFSALRANAPVGQTQ